MEENKRTDSGYTGEYGNPVEHNDAPQVETENAAAYSETAQSASEQGASAQAEQSSTYSYSYKNGEGTSTHSGDYYGGGASQPNNESAQQSGAGPQQMNGYGRYLWCCFRNMFPRRSLCNESLPAYDNIIYHEIAVNNRR